jgi:hypothetical protein
MRRREKWLHPATFISLLALFVALGGVGYAATRIGTKQLKNRAVTNKKLANNSVTTGKIRNGHVRNADLGDSSVFGAQLGDGAVGTAKLADGAVGSGKLGNGAVTSGKLAASAVTAGKLAASSVTSGTIAPNSVGAGQIIDGQVVEGDGRLQHAQVTVPDGGGLPILDFPGIGGFSSDCGSGQAITHFTNTGTTDIRVSRWGAGAADAFSISSGTQAPGGALDQGSGTDGISGTTWLASVTDAAGLHTVKIDVVTHEVGNDCLVTVQAIRTG